MTSTQQPTTWTHGGYRYHTTTWRIAPGYGARAWCLECDWARTWGNYNGAYSGWTGARVVESACFDHQDTTRDALAPTG